MFSLKKMYSVRFMLDCENRINIINFQDATFKENRASKIDSYLRFTVYWITRILITKRGSNIRNCHLF